MPLTLRGGRGSFLKAVSQKKYHSPLRWPNIWGFFPEPMGVSPEYGQTPNIWPLSSLDIDTALRKERRPPKPLCPAPYLWVKISFQKGGVLAKVNGIGSDPDSD